jgi:threonylcarbamoyladenosine tRNA methylthiotransferase MtaB
MNKKVALHTLGCKLNFAEGDTILRNFQKSGYQVVDFKEKADVYVINTCSVTHVADKKSRNLIRQAIKHDPEAVVIVTGCYAQNNAQEIAKLIPEVDFIVDNLHKKDFFVPGKLLTLRKPKNTKLYTMTSEQPTPIFFLLIP